MYNRYVPQSDGTFQRCRMPDESPRPEPRKPEPPKEPCPPPEPEPCSPPPPPPKHPQRPCQRPKSRPPRPDHRPEPQSSSIPQFLRNLLPRDFDTGDLLVVILLLLMSGDCQEDQNTALLTLALYLFM